MGASNDNADGWLSSLRQTGDSLLGLAQSRIELFAIELREEKLRDLNLIVRLVVALALVVAGMIVGLLAIALFLWEIAGYLGLAGLVVATLGTGATVILGIRRRVLSGPIPFAETISEFKKDRACLHRHN